MSKYGPYAISNTYAFSYFNIVTDTSLTRLLQNR